MMTETTTSKALYVSNVMHQRHDKHAMRFNYRIARVLLDIDRLDEISASTRLFSVDRWNIFSFRRNDHGPLDGSCLRSWAELTLFQEGVSYDGGKILLLAIPRLFGYTFNPISIWYCHDRQDRLQAVICEVRNTFGDYHTYVLKDGELSTQNSLVDEARKAFHVSPFMAIEGGYRFRITNPGDRYVVDIRYESDNSPLLTAIEKGKRKSLTGANLLGVLFMMPMMTVKVMAAIHWQALKLWVRGATFHPHPNRSRKETSK